MVIPLKADKSIDIDVTGYTNDYFIGIKIFSISYFKECNSWCISCSNQDKNICYSCITGYYLQGTSCVLTCNGNEYY